MESTHTSDTALAFQLQTEENQRAGLPPPKFSHPVPPSPQPEPEKGPLECALDYEIARDLQHDFDKEIARQMQSEEEKGRSDTGFNNCKSLGILIIRMLLCCLREHCDDTIKDHYDIKVMPSTNLLTLIG